MSKGGSQTSTEIGNQSAAEADPAAPMSNAAIAAPVMKRFIDFSLRREPDRPAHPAPASGQAISLRGVGIL
jgi:hypothetical protein